MAVLLSEVFIASNFEEFAPLRAEIKDAIDSAGFARAIDLNDNAADPQSALQRSRAWVRKADALTDARDDDEAADGEAAPLDHLDEFDKESGSRDSWASELELLERPAEAASAEQLREAKRARAIHDRSAAIHHLSSSHRTPDSAASSTVAAARSISASRSSVARGRNGVWLVGRAISADGATMSRTCVEQASSR